MRALWALLLASPLVACGIPGGGPDAETEAVGRYQHTFDEYGRHFMVDTATGEISFCNLIEPSREDRSIIEERREALQAVGSGLVRLGPFLCTPPVSPLKASGLI